MDAPGQFQGTELNVICLMAIVLIDQYPLLRLGLAQFLGDRFTGHSVSDFESIESFNESGMKPELVILGVNGHAPDRVLAILKSLRQKQSSSAVMIFDEKIEVDSASRYLNAGAMGYLSKSSDMASIEEGIRQVLKGERYIIKDLFDVLFDQEIRTVLGFVAGIVFSYHEACSRKRIDPNPACYVGVFLAVVSETGA